MHQNVAMAAMIMCGEEGEPAYERWFRADVVLEGINHPRSAAMRAVRGQLRDLAVAKHYAAQHQYICRYLQLVSAF